jgi:hypothetical protein
VKRFEVIFFLIVFACCSGPKKINIAKPLTQIKIKNRILYVRIASSPEEWEKGLMFTESLPDSEGMLFIFPEPRIASFWMKNTPIDLSIAYIDSSGIIQEIHDLKAYSEDPAISKSLVKYALEVNKGWFTENQIHILDTVEFPEEFKSP